MRRLADLNSAHVTGCGVLLAVLIVAAAPAFGQEAAQISTPRAANAQDVEQLTANRADAQRPGVDSDVRTPQLPAPRGAGPGQLTREAPGARAPDQLYRGARTAQSPPSPSRPADGRTAAPAARIGGRDRCDDRVPDAAIARACARAIETRSDEFATAPAPALSPEQRLLVDQQVRRGPETTRGASQRLAGEGDASSIEEQSVATVALRQGDAARGGTRPATPTADPSALSADTQAFINALVGSITAAPPRP